MNQPTAPCSPPSTNNPASRSGSPRGSRPAPQNQTSGTRNTTPISRPHSRWTHSSQKMCWNPASPKPSLTSVYCGICW